MLEGFKVVNLMTGQSNISISENGLSFSKTAILKMGKPEYVNFLINSEEKMIAIQVTDENDSSATNFLNPHKKSITVRWNNKELLNDLAKLMDWDFKEFYYKVNGDYAEAQQAMIFNLNEAVAMSYNDGD